MFKKTFLISFLLIISNFICSSYAQDQTELFFASWIVESEVVTEAKRDDTVTVSVSLSPQPIGRYRFRVMRHSEGDDEEIYTRERYREDAYTPFIFSLTFEASYATGDWGTIGYYVDVYIKDYYLEEHWEEVWTMPNTYPPRLKVSPWRIETISEQPATSYLDLDSNNYPHVVRNNLYTIWNGTHWVNDIIFSDMYGSAKAFTLDSNDVPHVLYSKPHESWDELQYTTLLDTEWEETLVGPHEYDPMHPPEHEIWGYTCSIDTDSNNLPHLAYGWIDDDQENHLEYQSLEDLLEPYVNARTFGGGNYICLSLDSLDNPHICFWRSIGVLVYNRRTDSNWYNIPESPDSGSFRDVSMALDSHNRPHITYYDARNGDLKYVHHTGSGWSTPEILDSEGDVGARNSIAIGDFDRPQISYIDITNRALKYIKKTSTGWSQPEILNNIGIPQVGSTFYICGTSIAIDSDNYAHITYASQTENWTDYEDELKYVTNAPEPPVVLDIISEDADGNFVVNINAGAVKGAPVFSVTEVMKSNIASYHVSFTDEFMTVIVEGQLEDPSLPGYIVLEIDPESTIITYKIEIGSYELTPSVEPIAVISCPIYIGAELTSSKASVTFDPGESHDPDGNIILYEWDFNSDGYIDIIKEDDETVSNCFSIGTHQVTLRVTDDRGLTGINERTIVVLNWWRGFLFEYGTFLAIAESLVVGVIGILVWRKYIKISRG